MCHNPKCNCQKQTSCTPKEYVLEGAGFTKTVKKILKESKTAWKNFLGLQ